MKKVILFISIVAICLGFSGCQLDDPYNGDLPTIDEPTFDTSTEAGRKCKYMYDTYGVYFNYDFSLEFYKYNYNQQISYADPNDPESHGQSYTPAKVDYVVEMLDSIEQNVFKVLPKDLVKNFMTTNVLLTAKIGYKKGTTFTNYVGTMATNYLLIGNVAIEMRGLWKTREYKQRMLSMFVERMLVNMPYPYDFENAYPDHVKGDDTRKMIQDVNNPLIEYYIPMYSFVKNSRVQDGTFYPFPTALQDFGDFVAFIVYTPEQEKRTDYYERVNAPIIVNNVITTDRKDYENTIENKVEMVKRYFKDNFDAELPMIPLEK